MIKVIRTDRRHALLLAALLAAGFSSHLFEGDEAGAAKNQRRGQNSRSVRGSKKSGKTGKKKKGKNGSGKTGGNTGKEIVRVA